jgi:hypothetical protein
MASAASATASSTSFQVGLSTRSIGFDRTGHLPARWLAVDSGRGRRDGISALLDHQASGPYRARTHKTCSYVQR